MRREERTKAKDLWVRRQLLHGYYHVTDNGEIVRTDTGRVLKQSLMSDGYCRVGISVCGHCEYVKAHRVVAIAKIPNPDEKPLVNHRDGVKSNNHPSNLEWVTALENSSHAAAAGLYNSPKGESCPSSKLNQAQVDEIRSLYATGKFSQERIGMIFGVKQNTVSMIVNRRNWA